MRNIEDIVLATLHDMLVEATGISSGKIFAKMPDFEFVNKFDTNRSASTNPDQFPSIGMKYWDRVKYSPNTYGESILVDNGNGTGIEYIAKGEYEFPIAIYLFTDSRSDQNYYGNLLMEELSECNFYELVNDVVTGEVVGVEFIGFYDTPNHRPYVKVFDILCCARSFTESSGYLVESIDVNLQSQTNSITVNENAQDTFSYFLPLPPAEIDEDTIYFQDWNIVPVDLTDDFGGTHERTIDDSDV